MALLNQIIAIEKGIKARTYSETSELYKAAQKPDLFNGFSKTYQPMDTEGEQLPPERKRVQHTGPDMIRGVERAMSELIAVTARKDYTNCVAKADVTLDGHVLVPAAPVSFLLFLEKQLTDLRTFVATLPILDEGENWTKDENSGLFKSDPTMQHKTKKLQKSLVLIQPTVEHPGQAQMITEDVLVGHWAQVKLSGALPKPERDHMVGRIEALLRAVKEAREEANIETEVETPNVGSALFDYITSKE